MFASTRIRWVAGVLLFLLVAPSVLCFASMAPQRHACCAQEATMLGPGSQNCCAFSSAPAPVQPTTIVVPARDAGTPVATAADVISATPSHHAALTSDSAAPGAAPVRLPSNLRI